MKKFLTTIIAIIAALPLLAHQEPEIDTLIDLGGVHITAIKQGLNLYREPISASVVSQRSINRAGITSIKQSAHFAPNIHIPDYGSRITSSIYVRGLGARIDNAVVGLNIDNVPYLNKNAFDSEVMDIERIEILRGPQSTLYGRNTMGGLLNIYTLSPLSYQGGRVGMEYSSGNTFKIRSSVYDKVGDNFGYAIGAHYSSSDGLYTNEYTNQNCNSEQSYGARAKVQYIATPATRIENTFAISSLTQDGYAYEQLATGKIAYNDPSGYERLSITDGLTIRNERSWGTIASITSYSYLDDAMHLDQDFTPHSYFTLTQATQEHSMTEDLIFKYTQKDHYKALFGLFGFAKISQMQAPVTFKEYGIQELILSNMNEYLAPYYYVWDEPQFTLNSDFGTRNFGAAIYHESKYTSSRFEATLSLRADAELGMLNYHNYTQTSCTVFDGDDKEYLNKPIDINIDDNLQRSYFELLPKVSALYRLGNDQRSTIYGSISKGYKAGGFNTQMFSDILQQKLMGEFGVGSQYDIEEVISYEPEHSWNYEIGTHIELAQGRYVADMAIFYINCTNQQLTVFPEGQITGRMMTNAGASRSCGAEISARAQVTTNWSIQGSYGYTNAKFRKYKSAGIDYAGKNVPYSPQQTFNISSIYNIDINAKWLNNIELEISSNGAGRIYWTELNDVSQRLYALVNSSITLYNDKGSISLWGRNLTNQNYDIFYFESIGNRFVQRGRPITFGATLSLEFN